MADQHHADVYGQQHGANDYYYDGYNDDQAYYQTDHQGHQAPYADHSYHQEEQQGQYDESGYYDEAWGYAAQEYNDQYYDHDQYRHQQGPYQDDESFSSFDQAATYEQHGYGGLNRSQSHSYTDGGQSSTASTTLPGMGYGAYPAAAQRSREIYPAWGEDAPLSKEEIEEIFLDLTAKFGFQRDSMRNQYDHFLTLLDSRASRMTPNQALLSLHADYIGGEHANYRRWYFAAHLDLDNAAGSASAGSGKKSRRARKRKNAKKAKPTEADSSEPAEIDTDDSLDAFEDRWKLRMHDLSQHERATQIALYLLCWGEANQVRFMPECLCFIYKCALDYLGSPECQEASRQPVEEFSYLNNIITPLYRYYRDQCFEVVDGRYVRREKDHSHIIGYDDINQLFWYPEGLERIVMDDKGKERLLDIPAAERYNKLSSVVWKKTFFKTFRETRSWFHLVTNFNRIWILHITMYWFYVTFNFQPLYTPGYRQQVDDKALVSWTLSIVALGGALASLIQMVATIAEWASVPRQWAGAQHLTKRFFCILAVFLINLAPSVYILFIMPILDTGFYVKESDDPSTWRIRPDADTQVAVALGAVQFVIAVFTMLYFGIVPLGSIFDSYLKKGKNTRHLASQTFTASWPHLRGNDRWMSYGMWVIVGGVKFGESYATLVLSLKDPVRFLHTTVIHHCVGDQYIPAMICKWQPQVLTGCMVVTSLALFFLDTYLWYVLVNVVFSISRSFYLGVSIWTPWRNIFSRLPKRVYSKVLAVNDMDIKYKPKILISQVWNAIIISMYREHCLDIDHVQKLLYHQVPSEQEGKRTLRAPTFFVAQEDHSFKTEFFPPNGEAERRISFFAQSLSTPIPEPCPVDNMPTFTVMIPHYSEKILLSLREIIREDEPYSRVTMLEYLKQLHPNEWTNFVRDTKNLAEETSQLDGDGTTSGRKSKKTDDLPFNFLGFKSSAPEYTLRTRIWASLRSQTLYRTISGFMNYQRAIKLLYRVENPEVVEMFGGPGNNDALEREFERMARRKFNMLVSMQRYSKFDKTEKENAEFLLRAYPDLQIAYLDEDPGEEGEEAKIYSTLIDGHSEILENGHRRPKFRIQLSGNPILGDGKSDNQNHAIIFYRGEYIQLIDANQDNYLEECLKIRSVLAEFEELEVENVSPYSPDLPPSDFSPVAILGAREYIFSENIGVLGDLAAGKEQTFGTLFARTLSQIGGKLHYGHPDFLNGIFMTTRGGVSKAQKGLHLNEDIYAGMNAMMRGGRIKHCEYYQCGKGRDLGFGSILNFTTKIGTGMGEQMLSREYYYLGTQLPLDRFLSFYYAHPGFHVNNIFIMLSVQLLMLSFFQLGALYHETIPCAYDSNLPITDPLYPNGCANLNPVNNWVFACCLSIFIVFWMLFIPLTIQDATERGFWRSASRLVKQFGSFSPLFEIFVCQIYSNSISQNMTFGGARYIATGRGFATARIPFGVLYSRFASTAIYLGARLLLIQLFITITIWGYWLLYFWVSLVALCGAPFLFNPHQFAWGDFFIDYRDYLRWLSRGNSRSHQSSWIAYVRMSRTKITGYKRKVIGEPTSQQKVAGDMSRAGFTNIFIGEIIAPLLWVILLAVPYVFMNSQVGNEDPNAKPVAASLRVLVLGLAPILVNAGVAAVFFLLACCMGPLLSMCCKKFGSVLAAIAHGIAVVITIVVFEAMFFLELWSFPRTLAGLIAMTAIQRFVVKLIVALCLTREMKTDGSNIAWWTGRWYGMGVSALSQPGREFLCKIVELTMFSGDFLIGHLILFLQAPIIVLPFVDKIHSTILFWMKPSNQIRPPIYSLKQSKLRNRRIVRYSILYFALLIILVALVVGPIAAVNFIPQAPSILKSGTGSFVLYQPTMGIYNDTRSTERSGTNIKSELSGPTGTGSSESATTPDSQAGGRKIKRHRKVHEARITALVL